MARPRVIDEGPLLAAARHVFIARGAEATTREVAEAAGVSQAVLFQRYRTKERLFFAAMLPAAPEIDTLIADTPPPGAEQARAYLVGLAERLLAWLDAAMPGSLRAALHPAFPAALARTHGSAGAEMITAAVAQRLDLLQMRGDVGGGSPTDVATTLLELLHGQALATMLGDAPMHRRAERAVAVLWAGLDPQRV